MKTLIALVILVVLMALVIFLMKQPVMAPATDLDTNTSTETTNTMDTNTNFITIAPNVQLMPVSHASAVMLWGETRVLADPVGPAEQYTADGMPDVVFITHRHGDHFDPENLPNMLGEDTVLIAPQDVADQLPAGLKGSVLVMAPGDTHIVSGLTFEAIAAYNVREEAQNYHPQSRGDIGVVMSDGTSRVYFSGDTEGTPEMRALQNIDVAFVAMNLPYTMDVDAAADAVLAFAPQTVYPYHFRTPDGFSDIERFKELVNSQNSDITVTFLNWYDADESEGN